jgi:hypothetical protein
MLLLDPSLKYHGRFKQTKWPAIPLGTRVRRGPSWSWENQDLNMAGTVIAESFFCFNILICHTSVILTIN